MLTEDMPDKAVADRADVSPGVLDKHYDRRTQEEKIEQQCQYLN